MSSASIDRAREEVDAAWLRSDADGITQHLAEDAVLMPPHESKKVGRQVINGWLRGFFDHYTLTDLAMPEREVTVAGDYAIERSLYEWTLRPKDGSEPLRDQANWIGIWRRDRDGWSEVCGMWNSTRPVPAFAGRQLQKSLGFYQNVREALAIQLRHRQARLTFQSRKSRGGKPEKSVDSFASQDQLSKGAFYTDEAFTTGFEPPPSGASGSPAVWADLVGVAGAMGACKLEAIS